jgi:hypothetical protein
VDYNLDNYRDDTLMLITWPSPFIAYLFFPLNIHVHPLYNLVTCMPISITNLAFINRTFLCSFSCTFSMSLFICTRVLHSALCSMCSKHAGLQERFHPTSNYNTGNFNKHFQHKNVSLGYVTIFYCVQERSGHLAGRCVCQTSANVWPTYRRTAHTATQRST